MFPDYLSVSYDYDDKQGKVARKKVEDRQERQKEKVEDMQRKTEEKDKKQKTVKVEHRKRKTEKNRI